MGTCKDEMKCDDLKNKTAKRSLLGSIKRNVTRQSDEEKKLEAKVKDLEAQIVEITKKKPCNDFSEFVNGAEDSISGLISIKKDELDNEKGREVYNKRQLRRLERMARFIYEIIDLIEEYNEDN